LKTYKKPSAEKWIDFGSELGSNGQFDEIAFGWFEEDNPNLNVDGKEYNDYCKSLQKNFNSRVK
jgi:hypothetical protein